jgi:hypothetical protein
MREDMYKVLVARPRHGKGRGNGPARLRRDPDGPARLGMRAGYGYLGLNENLNPLRRYLHAQVGRPWNKVLGEICKGIDRRNTVQQHIHQHIGQFIAIQVAVRHGRLVNLGARRGLGESGHPISEPLYVDPRTGLTRLNRQFRSWKREQAERRERTRIEELARRRALDERTLLLRLDDLWYRVGVDTLPAEHVIEQIADGRREWHRSAEPRYDVVLRRNVSRAVPADGECCRHLYGSPGLYATSKHQLPSREIRAHGLR